MASEFKLIGSLLGGRYTPRQVIGKGGMGTVYIGENVNIGKRIAIKVLNPELIISKEYLGRFEREARAATEIGHPHIVDIYDFGWTEEGVPFIIMEALDGEGLEKIIAREGALHPVRAVDIAGQILHALQATHDIGIVHRDLKPENIFLCKRKNLSWRADQQAEQRDFVKVLDFGISRFVKHDNRGPDLTQTGAIFGTPGFMSPEQAKGRKSTDHRADIYAVGVLLYNMFSGKTPFTGDSVVEILAQVIKGDCPRLGELCPMLPAGLVEIVYRSMALQPEDRFQSASECMEALKPFSALDPADSFVVNVPSKETAEPDSPPEPSPHPPPSSPDKEEVETTMPQFPEAGSAGEGMDAEEATDEEPEDDRISEPPEGEHEPPDLTKTPSTFVLTAKHMMRTRRRAVLMVTLPVVAILAISGFFIFQKEIFRALAPSRHSSTTTKSGSAAPPLPVHDPATMVEQEQEQDESSPTVQHPLVPLSITGSPEGALLLLDDEPLGKLPYEGQLVADGQEHELHAVLAGYHQFSTTIVPKPDDEDLSIELDMQKVEDEDDAEGEESTSSPRKKKKKKKKKHKETYETSTWATSITPEPSPPPKKEEKAEKTEKAASAEKKGKIIRDAPF